MRLILLLLISILTSTTLATSSRKVCTTYKASLTVTSENFVFNPALKFKDNFDVGDLWSEATARNANETFNPFVGKELDSAKYDIWGHFCTPVQKGPRKKTVLLATHGLGFDGG